MRLCVRAVFALTLFAYVATAYAAVTVDVNGVTHTIPQTGEKGWGTNVTAWIQAISANTLQPKGGTFTLTADANFGGTYGLVSPYYKSRATNLSTVGAIRIGTTESIGWRNTANSGNLLLGIDTSDRLTYNAIPFLPSTALTASRALASDASGVVAVSATTATELGYVSGVTSAIQTQLGAKLTDPMSTNGDLITRAAGIPARLGIGTSGYLLTSDGTAPAWAAPPVTLTLGAVGSSANANGATLLGGALNLEPASASFPGVVTTGTQTFAGAKTFNGNVSIGATTAITAVVGIGTTAGTGSLKVKANGTNYDSALALQSSNATYSWNLYPETNGFFYFKGDHLSIFPWMVNNTGQVGVGTGSPEAQLTVGVASDSVQLSVRSHSTQTSNLAQFKDTGGAVTAIVRATGALGIGGTATSSTVPGLYFVGDTNTGVGRSASDALNLIAGGVTALKVDASTALSTAGDLPYVASGGALARLAIGTTNQVLAVSGSGLPTWTSSGSLSLAVTTKTTTYTALTTDDVILASGSAFTITLYAASGNSGKILRVKKTDSSLTNIITIDGNASETIDGATTTTLNTQYEEVTIICDGSNWHILERDYPQVWVAYTPTLTGFGSPTAIEFESRRVGDSLEIQGKFTSGTATGVEARATLGFNGTNANVTSAGTSKISSLKLAGPAATNEVSANIFSMTTLMEPSVGYVVFGLQGPSTPSTAKRNANDFITSGKVFLIHAKVPIAGWN